MKKKGVISVKKKGVIRQKPTNVPVGQTTVLVATPERSATVVIRNT